MAVDEVLLEWAAAEQAPWLRLYAWSPATLSLGYFQQSSARAAHAASSGCPAVRRLTGGGAIVHDAELTYSLVLPAGHALARRRDRLYTTVHAALVEALAELGLGARLSPANEAGPQPEPFLCFQRRSPGDVVAGSTKVAGSAQRRRRGAVLQHGSILLARSQRAPELAGIQDLLARPVAPQDLRALWLPRLATAFEMTWQEAALTPAQRLQAQELASQRYDKG